LIDERSSNELDRVDFADREAVEPCLAFAAETSESGAASVPLCDVDAVRAALAEEDEGHGEPVYRLGEQNTKPCVSLSESFGVNRQARDASPTSLVNEHTGRP
jgi:hypothetical protein